MFDTETDCMVGADVPNNRSKNPSVFLKTLDLREAWYLSVIDAE